MDVCDNRCYLFCDINFLLQVQLILHRLEQIALLSFLNEVHFFELLGKIFPGYSREVIQALDVLPLCQFVYQPVRLRFRHPRKYLHQARRDLTAFLEFNEC